MKVLERLDAGLVLPEEERMLIESVKNLARNEFAPRADHHDRTAEFPWDNVKGINALGLNAMFIPEAYGGAPMSYLAYLACLREISKACASTGIIWASTFHSVKPVITYGSEEQKIRLLPRIAGGGLASLTITEPSAGSDATGMKTRFEPRGDEIIVNGSKVFITSGDVADLLLVFGKWSEISDPKGAISTLVLEKGTPGLSVLRLEDKLGHRASSTAALSFEDCRVPRANLLGAPGDGLKILLASLNKSRPSVAAHALGIARAAFEDAVAYINERRIPGHTVFACRPGDRSCPYRTLAVARRFACGCRRGRHGRRSFDAEDPGFRSRHAHDDRGGAAPWRLRLLQGLPRGAPDARCQGHSDLGGNQPDPPPADRPKLCQKGLTCIS